MGCSRIFVHDVAMSRVCIIITYTFGSAQIAQADEIYLHLVLEFLPETVYRVTRNYTKAKQHMPMIYVKVQGGAVVFLQHI